MLHNKIFKDPVHGYIEIPALICKEFIDTPIFQRLRCIEQTNMRVVYPSAHHDRFAHSLGVYYLGKLAFESLISNIAHKINEPHINSIKEKQFTFEIACLMHDCAHAPFSHTFEDEYDIKPKGSTQSLLDPMLLQLINNDKFTEDFVHCGAAPHEKASAIILLKFYKDQMINNHIDLVLCVRMILGCKYHNTSADIEKLYNSLIELLNSKAIDVDKLDYIIRDTWISGVHNTSIDTKRLLSSLTLSFEDTTIYRLVFKKSALSVINTVMEARNYLYKWVYSHHKVIYNEYLLKESLTELAGILFQEKPEDFFTTIFSLETFDNPIELAADKIHLVSDGDLLFLLKKYFNQLPSAKKYFSRNHNFSLWKNYEEFDLIFSGFDDDQRDIIRKNAKAKLDGFLNDKFKIAESSVILDANPKINVIKKNSIFIEINQKIVPFNNLSLYKNENSNPLKLFYIYCDKNVISEKQSIIDKLRSFA